jgi:N-acetylglutamate synthase-like GNAT family acetyltransferase
MLNEQGGYRIVEYEPSYEDGVKIVIGKVLKGIGVLPDLEGPVDDEDLSKILEIYSGRGNFWVALERGRVIGTVAIRDMGGETAKLNRMFVLIDYHGKGVGQALFEKALSFAKKQGFKKLILNTHTLMSRAHHFYEKNGFRRIRQDNDKYYYELNL